MTSGNALLLATLLPAFVATSAQTPSIVAASPATDATWTRNFSVPFDPQHSPKFQGMLITDPRFGPLLKTFFPQRQWFWYDHGRLVSTDELIYTFLGVSFGDPILDQGRYVTADGCVAHICNVERGMLWIDTAVHPADAIFVATNLVGGEPSSDCHLWIFSSTKLDWQHLASSFSASLTRWISAVETPGSGSDLKFVLATIVQPDGVMEDISPATLPLATKETGAKP
jgi:hypothetical protein